MVFLRVFGFSICLFFIGQISLQAQYLEREKRIPWPADSVFTLDSLSLVEPSLRAPEDSSLRFSFDLKANKVRLMAFRQKKDSILLKYSVFPFAAYRRIYRYNPLRYDSLLAFADYPGRRVVLGEKREELFSLPGIQKSGVISRGISLGNGQNGFVNSAMNLQLEGMISKDIRLTALLSDQAVPFQPQGNTQQIRDLDRIFIRLEHRKADLLAGDVQLQSKANSSFFRLYRNLQGGELQLHTDSLGRRKSRIAAGIAKGKFASVVVQVKEGVMGPYRLRPPDNPDLIFVILAGSERIWFDGRLLQRGFNQDYVIDYNSGEITLNNHLFITRFTRLRCDFEYAERNYSRTSLLAEHEEDLGRLRFSLGHYQEQDNPYRPLGFTLDSANLSMLRLAGDQAAKALLSGITLMAPSAQLAGNLYYEQRDTLVSGQALQYYRLSQSIGLKDLYRLSFSETPLGLGDYRLVAGLGNGKWFEYAGPGLGNYSLGRQAVLPNRKSMSRAGISADLGAGQQLDVEAVLSMQDLNRFSDLDDRDNQGGAQRLGWKWKRASAQTDSLQSSAGISITRLGRNFQGIDRFRDIEFERNWNGRSGDSLQADDYLLESGFQSGREGKWQLSGASNWRKKGDNVQGFQQSLDWKQKLGLLQFENSGYWMRNVRPGEKAAWQRLNSGLSLQRGNWIPFWQFRLDENEIRAADGKVKASAMHYRSQSLGIRTRDSGFSRLSAQYTYREDKGLKEGEMKTFLFSQNVEFNAGISPGGDHQLDLLGNYRSVKQSGLSRQEENLSARLDYRGSIGDGFLRQELVMTANTGQEAGRSFQFIRINAIGEGSHQWIDYNGNGLQELDEFVEARRPEDRQYIRIFIPTQDFISAYTRSLNYRLHLGVPAAWQKRGGWQKLLSRFVLLSSLSEDRKMTSGSLAERYLPLSGEDGEQVLSASILHRHTLFFNRSRPDFGAEVGLLQSEVKTLLSNGFAWRTGEEGRILLRKNISDRLNLSIQMLRFERLLRSDALQGQNYRLRGWEAGPELSWQAGISQRLSGQLQWRERSSRGEEEKTSSWNASMEYRTARAGSRNINASLRYSSIRFAGNLQSPAAYELLEGLLPGDNVTWTLNIQQKLSQGLQLLLSYDGRKSGSQRIIHLGKVQASLLF